MFPSRVERSGSSIRSCGVTGAHKNDIKSQKENIATNTSQLLAKHRLSGKLKKT